MASKGRHIHVKRRSWSASARRLTLVNRLTLRKCVSRAPGGSRCEQDLTLKHGPQCGPQLGRHGAAHTALRRTDFNLRWCSLRGAALAWQARGRRFETAVLHSVLNSELALCGDQC